VESSPYGVIDAASGYDAECTERYEKSGSVSRKIFIRPDNEKAPGLYNLGLFQ
jgi:hypothetical protein